MVQFGGWSAMVFHPVSPSPPEIFEGECPQFLKYIDEELSVFAQQHLALIRVTPQAMREMIALIASIDLKNRLEAMNEKRG